MSLKETLSLRESQSSSLERGDPSCLDIRKFALPIFGHTHIAETSQMAGEGVLGDFQLQLLAMA